MRVKLSQEHPFPIFFGGGAGLYHIYVLTACQFFRGRRQGRQPLNMIIWICIRICITFCQLDLLDVLQTFQQLDVLDLLHLWALAAAATPNPAILGAKGLIGVATPNQWNGLSRFFQPRDDPVVNDG